MNKKEFKKRLQNENAQIDIKMSSELQQTKIVVREKYSYQTSQMKKTSFIPRLVSVLSCAVIAFMCVGLLFMNNRSTSKAVGLTSYIMEINPAICITADKDDKIVNVCALNLDANEIVSNEELNNIVGTDFDKCVDKIMTIIKNNGYFAHYENAIKLYAFNDDEQKQNVKLEHFEVVMRQKVNEFGFNIPFEKHGMRMEEFKAKMGFDEDYQKLDDMQEFLRQKDRTVLNNFLLYEK